MKEWEDVHIFSYSWKHVVQAAFRKYPNPYSSQVHSLDTLHRRVSGKRMYSHRIFCTMWSIPTLVLKIIGTHELMHIQEQSVCDLQVETLTIYAQNISLTHLFTLNEKLEYSICKDDPSKTCLKQSATIDVHGVPLLGSVLESLWLNQYRTSVSNGRLGVSFIAEQLIEEESL